MRKVIQNLLKDLSPSIVTLVYKEIMQSSSLSLLSGPFSILERVYSLSTSAPGNEQMFLVALQTYSHFILGKLASGLGGSGLESCPES